MFFILSGLTISLVYHSNSLTNVKGIAGFYIKRIVRLAPLHILTLFLFLFLALSLVLVNGSILSDKYSLKYFIYNIFLIHGWGIAEGLSWNDPSWFVSTIILAYLFYPLVSYLVCCYINSFTTIYILVLLLVACLIISYSVLGVSSLGGNVACMAPFRGLSLFFMGVLLGKATRLKFEMVRNKWFLFPLFCIISQICYLNEVANFWYVPLLFISLFIFSLRFQWLGLLCPRKILTFLDNISFSLYIMHYFIFEIFKLFFVDNFGRIDNIGLFVMIFLTGAVSIVLHQYFEVPIRKILLYKCQQILVDLQVK